MPRLVAMSRSGDVLITEDQGDIWLHLPPTSGDTHRLSNEEAERYIHDGALLRVDENYASYRELGAAVQYRVEAIELPAFDTADWDTHDVERILCAIDRRLAEGDRDAALASLKRLASVEVVRADAELHARVIEQLTSALPTAKQPFVARGSAQFDDLVATATRRWSALVAA